MYNTISLHHPKISPQCTDSSRKKTENPHPEGISKYDTEEFHFIKNLKTTNSVTETNFCFNHYQLYTALLQRHMGDI
jgi:hypothetical protein